eukprot:8732832-Ditylum_brightwellii.AAC.1
MSDTNDKNTTRTPRPGVSWADSVRNTPSPAKGISKAFQAASASIECEASTIQEDEEKHKRGRLQRRKKRRSQRQKTLSNESTSLDNSTPDDGADESKANEPYILSVAFPNEVGPSKQRVYSIHPRCARSNNTKYARAAERDVE